MQRLDQVACASLATAHMKYRRADHCRLLASSAQHSIAGRQSGLRLPGDLSHPWRRRLLQWIQLLRADFRRMPIGPCALDQHVTNTAIPCLGDTAPSDCLSGRTLTRNKANIANELAGLSKRRTSPISVADVTATISDPHHVMSASPHDRRQRPGWNELLDHTLKPLGPLFRDANRLDYLLERNLMG